ncbi:MAG: hypothetical protein HPY65_18755 [Syntrophaceae bacterium]|nr:hypothetical protein [Syntrophaceae bacterium]
MNPKQFMRIMRHFAVLLAPAIVLLALWPAVAAGADYYQWTDEDGVLHISNMPPEETPKKQRRVKTTRLQDPAPASETAGGNATLAPVPGAAPVSRPPDASQAATGAPPKTAATAADASGASRTSGGSTSTAGSSPAPQAASGTSAPSEPFRSSQPPPDSTGQDSGTVEGAVNSRQQ